MSKCPIMDRMKSNYENRNRQYLTRRTPVIIRCDGKAFHTYTRGMNRPFDRSLMEGMLYATRALCQEIQGAKCGYTQSDEISILITDYDRITTDAWFDYNVQKMASVAASIASSTFNYYMRNVSLGGVIPKVAFFDARCFNIPEHEVANYFYARQRDAVRNSVSMYAQAHYSHKELHKKSQSDMHDMLMRKGINWNDEPYDQKRGSFLAKVAPIESIPCDTTLDEEDRVFLSRKKWTSVETPKNFSTHDFYGMMNPKHDR